jgi:nitrite reductase (NADH) small subunit
MRWIKIGSLHDIPRRGARCVATPRGRIAVFRTGDNQAFAIVDRCPHQGGPLSQGIVHGTSVTCPLHNWVISLETGKALGADEGAVRTIPVKIIDAGELFISIEAATSWAA